MSNNYGRTSVINLQVILKDDRTVLKDCYFTAPFKVMNPFLLESGVLRIMLMSTSAGIMAGDHQEMNINIEDNAAVEIISQSYEKIHKMDSGKATRISTIHVGGGAYLNYNPQPTIPYANSAFENTTNIYLKDNTSKLIYNEILSSGRVFYGESFAYTFFKNDIQIFQNNVLVYRDNSLYDPKLFDMSGYGLYEGHTHFLNQVICNIASTKDTIDAIRNLLDSEYSNLEYGVTDTHFGHVVVRILANEGDLLEKVSKRISEVI